MVSYDVLGPGGRTILHAQTPLVQSDVKRTLLSVGKLTQSGAEVKFGDKNSWIDLQTDAGVQRVPVRVKGNTFGLLIQKTDARIIPETSDPAPHAVVARSMKRSAEQNNPSLLMQQRKLQRHQGRKRLKACGSSEKPVTLQQTGRVPDSWDNRSAREDSRVAAMLKTCETG